MEELKLRRIQEFSDDELLKELSLRFDDFIIAGRKVDNEKVVDRRRYWHGDYDACAGLANAISNDCISTNWGVKSEDLKY